MLRAYRSVTSENRKKKVGKGRKKTKVWLRELSTTFTNKKELELRIDGSVVAKSTRIPTLQIAEPQCGTEAENCDLLTKHCIREQTSTYYQQ